MPKTRYFMYTPENESPFANHAMYDTWVDAACAAMQYDGYNFACRQIDESDLTKIVNIVRSDGEIMFTFKDGHVRGAIDIARTTCDAMNRDAGADRQYSVVESFEYDELIGKFGLWVTPRSIGNNLYAPTGINHRDFVRYINGDSVEQCLRQYAGLGDDGYCHARHHVVVAEATFDDNGTLATADGKLTEVEAARQLGAEFATQLNNTVRDAINWRKLKQNDDLPSGDYIYLREQFGTVTHEMERAYRDAFNATFKPIKL